MGRIDISLPKNSVELRMKLQIRARQSPKADYETTDEDFMCGWTRTRSSPTSPD